MTDPYPHIVIENALSDAYYERLEAAFPPLAFFVPDRHAVGNQKYISNGANQLESDHITPFWKAFVSHHMSTAFYQEFLALFGDVLKDYYGEVEEVLGRPFEALSTGHRTPALSVPNMSHPFDIVLDCQPQLDFTFTDRPFRGPHVDSPTEIYAGLFYMRDPDDDSEGGALAVWRAKDEAQVFPRSRTLKSDGRSALVERDKLDLVYESPYRANTLVLFINSWRSLHCAQTRSPSLLPRRAVNIIGEICRFPRPQLFDIETPKHLQSSKGPSNRGSLIRRAARRLLKH